MIKTLNSWRGIFALCIVCFHFAMRGTVQMTLAGVAFFFMLSGFFVTLRKNNTTSIKTFYKHRAGRIFPLHWLVLLAMIALDLAIIHKFHYGWDLPLHVALLQSWIPKEEIVYNYSIHSWFLSTLLMCVLATPLLLKLLKSISYRTAWAIVITACVVVSFFNLFTSEPWYDYLYVYPASRVVDYTLGMMLGIAMSKRQVSSHLSTSRATLIELGVLILFAAFIALHACGNAIAVKLGNSSLWWIPMSILIVSSIVLNGNEGLIGKCLTIRPLLWLGEISFEIYILQKLVNNAFCYLIAPFFGHFGIMIYDYSFACTLPLLLLTAWGVHWLLRRKKSTISSK